MSKTKYEAEAKVKDIKDYKDVSCPFRQTRTTIADRACVGDTCAFWTTLKNEKTGETYCLCGGSNSINFFLNDGWEL